MATTIYTYLHNDDLSGSRIVSMDDCMCKLYNIKKISERQAPLIISVAAGIIFDTKIYIFPDIL